MNNPARGTKLDYRGQALVYSGGGLWETVFSNPHTGQDKVWIARLADIKAEVDRIASGAPRSYS